MTERDFFYERRNSSSNFLNPDKHYHNNFELYYLKEGRCKYFINNKIFEVEKNDIIIIPEGVIHNTSYYTTENYERILIEFSKEFINPVLISELQYFFKKRIYRPKDPKHISSLFQKIELEYNDKSDISTELIKCYMTELFSYIARNQSMISEEDFNAKENEVISEIIKYILENINQELSLDEMAKKAGFNKFYFSKFFKASTGFGYKEFVIMTRLREAKKLLSQTDLSICDVAFRCGFNDSNYFSNIFKKKEGVTPLYYKKHKYTEKY